MHGREASTSGSIPASRMFIHRNNLTYYNTAPCSLLLPAKADRSDHAEASPYTCRCSLLPAKAGRSTPKVAYNIAPLANCNITNDHVILFRTQISLITRIFSTCKWNEQRNNSTCTNGNSGYYFCLRRARHPVRVTLA